MQKVNSPCYVIAEIGSNHNNDLSLAKETIDAARISGADGVKFQAFKAESHYSKYTPRFNYLGGKDTFDLIKSLEIDRNWHAELIDYCNSLKIDFLSSPCDREAVDQLDGLGMSLFKVASFDITDTDLVGHIASKQKTIILSCGMANLHDVERAVHVIERTGAQKPILLQCTSLYPAPPELSNLNAMATLRQAFGCSVGYSDHTLGIHVPIAAVALGASMIEKHFTLSQTLEGPDHSFASEPSEFREMVNSIRDVEAAMGDGLKNGPRDEELEMFQKGRRSLHLARDIKAGEVLMPEDLVIKRPGFGLPVHLKDFVIGRKVQKDILKDQWLTKDML